MSFNDIRWAIDQQSLSSYAKWVLVILADYQNAAHDKTWPKIATLAKQTGLSESSVRRGIKELIKEELVSVNPRNKGGTIRSNEYFLATTETAGERSRGTPAGVHGELSYKEEEISEQTNEQTICGEPQSEDSKVKVSDVLVEIGRSKEDIFSKAKRTGGKLTSGGCAYLWRNCRASADSDNGFQAELIDKEKKQLHNAYKRVGEIFPEVVWAVMENWVAFGKHAESTTEVFNIPLLPSVSFFVKCVEAAADYTQTNQGPEDHGFPQLIAKAKKPLTKPKETSDNTHKGITIEELRAIGKEMFE